MYIPVLYNNTATVIFLQYLPDWVCPYFMSVFWVFGSLFIISTDRFLWFWYSSGTTGVRPWRSLDPPFIKYDSAVSKHMVDYSWLGLDLVWLFSSYTSTLCNINGPRIHPPHIHHLSAHVSVHFNILWSSVIAFDPFVPIVAVVCGHQMSFLRKK